MNITKIIVIVNIRGVIYKNNVLELCCDVMKKIVFSIFLFFIGITFTYAKLDPVILDKCIDGDTATFILNDEIKTYRFISINAPEVKTEKYGKEASEYVCNLLKNAQKIEIEYDDKATKDKYDRILSWIWIDGKLLQETIIENGYAEVAYVYDDYKYTKSLCLVQNKAITNKKNIWSDGEREEDYCAQIDLSQVDKNIEYSILADIQKDYDNLSEEEIKDLEKIADAFQKLDDFTNKTNSFTESVYSTVSNNTSTIVIIILVVAGIYIILKEIKNSKK